MVVAIAIAIAIARQSDTSLEPTPLYLLCEEVATPKGMLLLFWVGVGVGGGVEQTTGQSHLPSRNNPPAPPPCHTHPVYYRKS